MVTAAGKKPNVQTRAKSGRAAFGSCLLSISGYVQTVVNLLERNVYITHPVQDNSEERFQTYFNSTNL